MHTSDRSSHSKTCSNDLMMHEHSWHETREMRVASISFVAKLQVVGPISPESRKQI